MSDLKKYWYVGKKNIRVIENNISSVLTYGDLVEGREDKDTVIVFAVDGTQIYGEAALPAELFQEVDYKAAYLIEKDDVDKD